MPQVVNADVLDAGRFRKRAELLPEVATALPAKLALKRVPAALCGMLNSHPKSPFCGLIRRASTPSALRKLAVVADASIVSMIEVSLNSPSGCLFPCPAVGPSGAVCWGWGASPLVSILEYIEQGTMFNAYNASAGVYGSYRPATNGPTTGINSRMPPAVPSMSAYGTCMMRPRNDA